MGLFFECGIGLSKDSQIVPLFRLTVAGISGNEAPGPTERHAMCPFQQSVVQQLPDVPLCLGQYCAAARCTLFQRLASGAF